MKVGMIVKNKHTRGVAKIVSERVIEPHRWTKWLGPMQPYTVYTLESDGVRMGKDNWSDRLLHMHWVVIE